MTDHDHIGATDRDIAQMIAACCPRDSAVGDVVRLALQATFAGAHGPALPPGRKLFVTNHQISVDLLYLSSWLLGVRGERCVTLAWDGLDATQAGQLVARLAAHPGLAAAGAADWLQPLLIDTRNLLALAQLPQRLHAMDPPASVIVATEGLRHHFDAQSVTRVGMALVDAALTRDMPIVPVRFAWALPEASHGHRFSWPHALTPMRISLGDAMLPGQLKALSLPQRRDLIATRLNALYQPPPPGHRDRNAARFQRIRQVMAETGINETKALLIDLFLSSDRASLSAEGRVLRDLLTEPLAWKEAHDPWIVDFASYVSDGGVTLYPAMLSIYPGAFTTARAGAWR